MNRFISNKIIYAGFILSILVIWVHAVNMARFDVRSTLQSVLGNEVGQIAVPGFFMLSGYLFFRGFDIKDSATKLKRRVRSVLVPYLIWNTLYYIAYIIFRQVPVDLPTALKAVFFHKYNPVFWYMQQLIVLFLMSPLVCVIIRQLWSGILLLIFIAVLIFFDIIIPVINLDALFYYTAAGMAAYYLREYAESPGSLAESLTGLVLIALGAGCVFLAGITSKSFFLVIMRTLCPVGLWTLLPAIKLPEAKTWMRNSFMVYAMHYALLKVINYAGASLLPHTVIAADILYLVSPAIIIAAVCGIVYLLKKFTPELYKILNGFRR